MAQVRKTSNGFELVEWTDEINNIDHQYGFFTGMKLFKENFISKTEVSFDKSMNDTTLLPDSSRRLRDASKGVERKVETFLLPLGYFKHEDAITPEDIQNIRAAGTAAEDESFATVVAEKLEDMDYRVKQTHEYMMLNAAKGICKTPQGTVLANMFDEFDIQQQEVAFEFGNNSVNRKISELKQKVQSSLMTGTLAGDIRIIVGQDLFNSIVEDDSIRTAYLYYQNEGSQRYRDDLATYQSWGITEVFRHAGVEFLTYNATFKLPDGTTEKAVEDDEGFVVLPTARDMYRAYFGPANKLSGASRRGRRMFAYQYADPRDEFYDLEVETSPLFIPTQPKAIIKVKAA